MLRLNAYFEADDLFTKASAEFHEKIMLQLTQANNLIENYKASITDPQKKLTLLGKEEVILNLTRKATLILLSFNDIGSTEERVNDITSASFEKLNINIQLFSRARKEEKKLYYCTQIEKSIIETENIIEPLKLEIMLEKKVLMAHLHELHGLMAAVEN